MTYILPPYTPERIESLRTAEPHNPGDPMPNDVAFANARAIIEVTEAAGCPPDEIGLDAIGGLALYWYEPQWVDVSAFNGGPVIAVMHDEPELRTRTIADPSEVIATVRGLA